MELPQKGPSATHLPIVSDTIYSILLDRFFLCFYQVRTTNDRCVETCNAWRDEYGQKKGAYPHVFWWLLRVCL
jgi:hypothetical protein